MGAIEVLEHEFAGESDATFLMRLRIDVTWDRAAFTRLEQAMREACAEFQERDELPRSLADGFYYVSYFVRSWTSHPSFRRPDDHDYYEACLQRLDDLASWFFSGHSPYDEDYTWPRL
jgi:hypothetical protein